MAARAGPLHPSTRCPCAGQGFPQSRDSEGRALTEGSPGLYAQGRKISRPWAREGTGVKGELREGRWQDLAQKLRPHPMWHKSHWPLWASTALLSSNTAGPTGPLTPRALPRAGPSRPTRPPLCPLRLLPGRRLRKLPRGRWPEPKVLQGQRVASGVGASRKAATTGVQMRPGRPHRLHGAGARAVKASARQDTR